MKYRYNTDFLAILGHVSAFLPPYARSLINPPRCQNQMCIKICGVPVLDYNILFYLSNDIHCTHNQLIHVSIPHQPNSTRNQRSFKTGPNFSLHVTCHAQLITQIFHSNTCHVIYLEKLNEQKKSKPAATEIYIESSKAERIWRLRFVLLIGWNNDNIVWFCCN